MGHYLASYDIGDDRCRRRVSRVLMRYGVRLQKSVFEVDADPESLTELQIKVGRLLGKSDAFDLIPIDQDPQRRRLSWQGDASEGEPVIVVE
ncbi:MAG: CRISPR-associated endonuclease Cas2 [Pirellulaceae bacterium]